MKKKISKIEVLPKLAQEYRVAAYARVSTDKDAMKHSLSTQVSYYSELIQNHPGWVYAGVYADEGITGTKADRTEFKRLIADCRAGKINLILTKSISRFARNSVTLLETVRELRALHIDIFFERENLHSLNVEGEFLLTIAAIFAQEESRSASENMKLRIRHSYEQGESMCWRFMYGYRISKDGGVVIDPEAAPVVREIYRRIIAGNSITSICRWLNSNHYSGVHGGKWQTSHIRPLLSNEKYLGDNLLQKTYINNHLEKKKCLNQGEIERYYVKDSHPAIIDRETFNAAQEALRRIEENNPGRQEWKTHDFTGMIKCPRCGRAFRRTHTNGTYGWICATYLEEGKTACPSKKIPEDTLKKILCDVLGIDFWLPELFHAAVEQIIAASSNTIEIHMYDGTVHRRDWKDRSRAESWTPEMKERARQAAMGKKNG